MRSKQLVLITGFVAAIVGIGASTAAAEVTSYFQKEGSNPLAVVAGAEGDLWYTATPKGCLGAVTRFALPGDEEQIGVGCAETPEERTAFEGSGTNGIALGPENDLWFTAGGGIGRIEPSATKSEDFLLPPVKAAVEKSVSPPNTSLGGITTGPEHENLWFTEVENNTSKIGRIDPTKLSEIEEYTLPPQNDLGPDARGASSENIAAGPNNTLWFTEPGSHAIGVVNTKGEFMDRLPLEATDDPQSIAAGPEGNMWFTDPNAPYAIGRINPAGEVSEFPAPSPPASIVKGPDGNMWFTQGGSSEEAGVGCIIPTGQIELIHERTEGGDPVGIAVNNDDTIWFTQSATDRLDHLYPVVCGAKLPPPPTTTNGSNPPSTPPSGNTPGTTPITPKGGGTPPTPPLATVLGLPPAQQCVSKRTLLVHVHAPPGQQLLSVKLSLRGKVLRAETFTKGKNDKVPPTLVDLRGLPKGTFTLTIVVETKEGKTYRATRTYHTCVPGKHRKGKGH
jgi:streptogramin lyase